LLLALSDAADRIEETVRRARLVLKLFEGYRNDPDPGIHGATRLLLQQLGQSQAIRLIDHELERTGPSRDRRWFVEQGHTMVVIDPTGSDPNLSSARPIDRVFAIADREVTLEQFHRMRESHPRNPLAAPEADCAVGIIKWFDAAAYCRWLDDRVGVPEAERCFPPIAEIKDGMAMRPDYLKKIGHRLPTSGEWEYACRAGAYEVRSYGNRDELLEEYAWYLRNSGGMLHPVGRLKPNALGLFDMHGNVLEWCQESVKHINDHRGTDVEDLTPAVAISERVIRGGACTFSAEKTRADYMGPLAPATLWDNIGFRVVRTIRPAH
jgi:formylglycine-generating enzyme required for sulfatase activity